MRRLRELPLRANRRVAQLAADLGRLARRRDCVLIMFLAYDSLAREFYDRLGYQRVGVILGCPAGSRARWCRKDL